MDCLALDASQVDGVVEGADDAVITEKTDQPSSGTRRASGIPLSEAVLDVVERRVDEDTGVVPCA